MGERRDAAALEAKIELTELIHDWLVKWVPGHVERDRYNCGAAGIADEIARDLAFEEPEGQ